MVELRSECAAAYYVIMGHLAGLESGCCGRISSQYCTVPTRRISTRPRNISQDPKEKERTVIIEVVDARDMSLSHYLELAPFERFQ